MLKVKKKIRDKKIHSSKKDSYGYHPLTFQDDQHEKFSLWFKFSHSILSPSNIHGYISNQRHSEANYPPPWAFLSLYYKMITINIRKTLVFKRKKIQLLHPKILLYHLHPVKHEEVKKHFVAWQIISHGYFILTSVNNVLNSTN